MLTFRPEYTQISNKADGDINNCFQWESEDGSWLVSYIDQGVDWGPTDTVDGETAIIVGETGKYYILNGDWREAYRELIPEGLDACMAFFHSKPQSHSTWSN